jgi:CrcB protein
MLFISIFLGGGSGALARFILVNQINKLVPSQIAYGTISVNIIGALLIGMIYYLILSKLNINENIKVFITVGFLGGFTTFSSFNLEFFKLLESGNFINALIYAVLTFAGTILSFYSGFNLMKVIT